MPSRKQRRRRQKERRHEYEFVYVDESGHEVDAPPPAANGAEPAPQARSTRNSEAGGRRVTPTRSGAGARTAPVRKVDPPSWARVGKRALIFAPLMFIAIALLDRSLAPAQQVLITVQMLVVFVPFSYVVDRAMYRRYLRQTGAPEPASRRAGRRDTKA